LYKEYNDKKQINKLRNIAEEIKKIEKLINLNKSNLSNIKQFGN